MTPRLAGVLAVLLAAALAAVGATVGAPAYRAWTRPAFKAWGEPGRKRPGTFDKPRCLSIGPDGTLWVLDLTGRIQHFTPEGEFLGELRMPDVSVGRPQGIDAAHDGCVYVADTHYNQVIKFAPDGEILLRFGEEGTDEGKLFWPCAIAVDADGTIFTAEYGGHDRIQVWNPDGAWRAAFGSFGTEPGRFMRPAGLALGPDGLLYVADAANHRVQVFRKTGEWVREWSGGDPPDRFSYPYDIAADAAGRLYTVEYGAHRVRAFSPEGVPLAAWGKLSTGEDGLSHPWGLDVTPDGHAFVADTYNCRVVRAPISAAE